MGKNKKIKVSDFIGKYEKYLVMNFGVKSRRPFDLTKNQVEKLCFEKVVQKFPSMTDIEYPKEDGLSSEDDSYSIEGKERILRISQRKINIGTTYPLSFNEQDKTCTEFVDILHSMQIINSPIQLDWIDLRFLFELKCNGNHHEKILKSLFKESCFGRIVNHLGSAPTVFNPEILILDQDDNSMRYFIEIRPQTSIREILSDQYDNDEIMLTCGLVKKSNFKVEDTLNSVYERLKSNCLNFFKLFYLKDILEPISKGLRGKKES